MKKLIVLCIVLAFMLTAAPAITDTIRIPSDMGMYYYSENIPATSGSYYFVGSAGSSEGAGSDSYNGTNPRQPLATIDAAINKCTAASTTYPGDVIIVLPQHTEDLDAATDLVADIAGLHIIGLGSGSDRPRLDYTGTAGSILVSGAGTTIENIIFENQIDSVVECVDIGADDVTIKNCEFRDGTGTSGLIFIMADGANTADRFKCYDTTFTFLSGTENGDVGIEFDDAQDGVELVGLRFYGDYDESCIISDAVCTNMLIKDIFAENKVSGQHAIEFSGAATGFIDNVMMYTNALGTALDPGSLYLGANIFWSAGANTVPQQFPGVGEVKVATCTTTAAASTDNMFDVGGPIIITNIFGISTAAAAGSPGTMTLEFDATTGADYDNDLSTTVNVDALGAGDAIHFTNAISEGVLTLTANVGAGQPLSWICGDPAGGVIEQTLSSTGTLAITWYITYIPLTITSTVAAST